MYTFVNKFLWKNDLVLEHYLELDNNFLVENQISKITETELIKIFEHFYGIDISDYGFSKFTITDSHTKLTIHLKQVDQLRQLQLRKLL